MLVDLTFKFSLRNCSDKKRRRMFKCTYQAIVFIVFVVANFTLYTNYFAVAAPENNYSKATDSIPHNMDLEYVNLGDLTDSDIAVRMRKCNYEKFKTLVRMHLSFELDLNTDEFDLPCHEIVYEDKGKLKKWNRMSKKHKHAHVSSTGCAATAKGGSISPPTEGLHQQIDAGFLFHLNELKDFLLLKKNLTQEGIFRKTGSVSRQNELRMQIQNDKPLDLEGGGYSAHDCATIFKGYLADLPEPLLTDAHYPAHLQIAPLCIGSRTIIALNTSATSMKPPNPERLKREQHLLNSVQLLLLLLPEENRELLQHIIQMLNGVAMHEESNKMSPENLATLFAPHLICPRNLPPEALHYVAKKMSSIIAYMISRGTEIFEMPAKLSTDIRAYFLERKRKKTMSPEQTLDESISDISTVNTVYTFVDREKTAAAHTANNTDTELAQLYAHIQSMPESSKKRRLIKQFNKQNGQGTPLQLVVMNRLKNSEASRSAKSISDSIKKHIFHKNIMSRTPKRTTAAAQMTTGLETPTNNFSNIKNPKLRVLFQSPAPAVKCATVSISTITAIDSATTSSSTCSASTYAAANTNTLSIATKPYPLQKSISTSSLLLSSSLSSTASSKRKLGNHKMHETELETSSSSSSDGFSSQHCPATDVVAKSKPNSASAPVSRQTSSDLHHDSRSSSSFISTVSLHSASSSQLMLDPNCCVTPLKIISDAAKQLLGHGNDKKTVAWDEDQLLEIEENSNLSTPLQKQSVSDFKSRYKSEPNLSRLLSEKLCDGNTDVHAAVVDENSTPISKGVGAGKSLTRKLMKGVSMGNLKFPFSTPESTRRLVRTVSSTLKRRLSDEATSAASVATSPLLEKDDDEEDLDDDTFEDEPDDHVESDSDVDDDNEEDAVDNCVAYQKQDTENASVVAAGGSSSSEMPGCYQHMLLQQSSLYRNIDLITSTPSLLLGRRSMSPITKSTQRMPKAMQESIMTPRSRKPVMVLTTTLGSSDPNQTLYQTDLSSFREQDEEDSLSAVHSTEKRQPPTLHNEDATSLGGYRDMLRRRQLMLQGNQSFVQQSTVALAAAPSTSSSEEHSNDDGLVQPQTANVNALTNNFKEYLLSRSVLTASPVDSSFSSQPDDFGSTQDIEDLDESQLSPSLLYCLDGNQPDKTSNDGSTTEDESNNVESTHEVSTEKECNESVNATQSTARFNRLSTNPFVILNNARKRAANSESEKNATSVPLDGTNSTSTMTTTRKSRATSNKENCEHVESYRLSKKLLISEFPGETSF